VNFFPMRGRSGSLGPSDPAQSLPPSPDLAPSRRPSKARQIYGVALAALRRRRGGHARAAPRTAARLREALALMQAGDLAAAETAASEVAEHSVDDAAALNLLGVIRKNRDRMAEAVAAFERAAAADPRMHAAWFNLGNALLAIGAHARAVAPMERAAALNPRDSETQRLLGRALAGAGGHEAAMAAFGRAEALDPTNARVHASRTFALHRPDAPDAAVLAEIDRLIAREPDCLEHLRSKALYLQRRSRFAQAEAVHRAILEREPEDFETLLRLGYMLGYALLRYAEANEYLRRGLAVRPDNPSCLEALAKSLLDGRRGDVGANIDEANQLAHRLLAAGVDLQPHAANLICVFLQTVDFAGLSRLPPPSDLMEYWTAQMDVGSLHTLLGRVVTAEDRRQLIDRHREWGRRTIAQAEQTPIRRRLPRAAPRPKIRVGIMSSDLRDHPVTYFALPIFQHYDRSRFEIFCYTFYPAPPDPAGIYIGQRVEAMRSMPEASDGEIAQRIADDGLDILFELGGTTRYNRLAVMAYRAAPVQASWLGYPHSAGLETIDYILVDPYLKPKDPALLIEQPLEMPESWVSLGPFGFHNEPIDGVLPQDRQGALTFGTMNNPYKYTPETFALWASAMHQVEGSRFLFARTEAAAPCFRENVEREFESHGIARDRVECVAVRGRHLQYYNRIDIALDTAPHTGGTTTCETLWMGVPVVTLVGEAFFERLSYSNLSNAGLGGLCAFSREQYADIAVGLAAGRAQRRELRQNLRPNLRRTPLGDSVRWVKNLEAAIAQATGRASGPNRFATDSPLEGTGFEPSVPRDTTKLSVSPLVGSPPTEKSE
jgi:protein O-GlcNAc transferase